MYNHYVVFGVSGSGKSTIGQMLAKHLNIPFFEGDNFHPAKNVDKLKNGIPLTDNDRLPWLKLIAEKIETTNAGVFSCSALKEKYRTFLTQFSNKKINWIFLNGSYDTIYNRLANRKDHFFNITLLKSQFDILEIPRYALNIDINSNPNLILKEILNHIKNE